MGLLTLWPPAKHNTSGVVQKQSALRTAQAGADHRCQRSEDPSILQQRAGGSTNSSLRLCSEQPPKKTALFVLSKGRKEGRKGTEGNDGRKDGKDDHQGRKEGRQASRQAGKTEEKKGWKGRFRKGGLGAGLGKKVWGLGWQF